MVKCIPRVYLHVVDVLYTDASHDRKPNVPYQPLPCHNELFTGREEYLEKLRRYFTPRNASWPRRCFLLWGMGGIGKTQISLKFVEEPVSIDCWPFCSVAVYEPGQILANFLGRCNHFRDDRHEFA